MQITQTGIPEDLDFGTATLTSKVVLTSNNDKLSYLRQMINDTLVPESIKPALYSILGNRFTDKLAPNITHKYHDVMVSAGASELGTKYYYSLVYSNPDAIFDVYTRIDPKTLKRWDGIPIKNIKYTDMTLAFYDPEFEGTRKSKNCLRTEKTVNIGGEEI